MSSDFSEEYDVATVIDVGTGFVKCGWAGDDAPKGVFPSLISRPQEVGEDGIEFFVGEEARERQVRCFAVAVGRGVGWFNVAVWEVWQRECEFFFFSGPWCVLGRVWPLLGREARLEWWRRPRSVWPRI